VPHERAEEARAVLLGLAPGGFEERHDAEGVELAVYVDEDEQAERFRDAFGRAQAEPVAADWAERWRTFHRSVRIGPLWIGPPWEAPPADAVAVTIDPGRAFGTGGHATTRLCLELLLDVPRGPLADLGCGSGVLAIAAARLGFAPVVAVDSDLAAVEATAENARRNRVAVAVRRADVLAEPPPECDVAVANIERAAVERLAGRVRSPHLVTSGYLALDELELPGYARLRRVTADGWAADLFRRKA
jgi:ribosomal protein L11 methyltransferase